MPYEDQAGATRHTVLSTSKALVHGAICVEDGFVGVIFKVDQPDRFTRPAQADDIAIATEAELQIGGIAEAPATGNLAAAAVGNDVYIKTSDNTLGLAAQGITTGSLTAGWRKLGKVTEIDVSRNPDVLRINTSGEVLAQVVPLG